MLNTNGIPAQIIYNRIKSKQRKQILETWGKESYALLSVHILEIGYDIPHIGIAIIIANSFSSNQIAQTIGRIIRKSVGKEQALIYVIYIKDTKDDNVLRIVKSAIEKSGEQRSSDNTLQLSLFHEAPNNSA